jgi:hypothetical protein
MDDLINYFPSALLILMLTLTLILLPLLNEYGTNERMPGRHPADKPESRQGPRRRPADDSDDLDTASSAHG